MSKMTRYAEAKSVKVDNWGVFFLQKLQNFFNKTDHCDLTLQFNDNSQLKVHRLVLSACTDYFNHLENVCEMYDDVLIMPMDLQADVIVPIVNFMYTGTLEFQYNMYDRLLKTATDMNMTVLLKLLEAHRQTSSRIVKQPVLLNKQAPRPRGAPVYQGAGSRVMPAQRGPNVGPRPRLPVARQPVHMYGHKGAVHSTKDVKPGPSRFDDGEMGEGFEGSFDGITYETKPLLTADQVKKEEETSPFEKLRKGYTNANVVKRSSSGSLTSPPAKKPNLDEVKEFTEAARMRSQLTTHDDDSPDYVDDDTHFNDDDDEDYQPPASVKAALAKSASHHASMIKHGTIKQESKSPGSAGGNVTAMKQITVKDDSGSVDHAKIISEVLKKYPHLVKKNKNIKLKIMQKPSPNNANTTGGSSSSGAAAPKMEVRTATPLKQDLSMVRRATANIRSETAKPSAASTTSTGKPGASGTTKTIDAKTMHALIAKGAENTTGPWLCLRCGINGRPISIPSYKAFYNHLIHKHKERIDVRICEHCGFKAQQRNPHLFYHWFTEHKVKPAIKFPRCDECDHVAMTADDLQKHEEEVHSRGDLQQCIYCNKVFAKEMELYDHMKEQHKERAIADGVLEFTDDEDYQSQEEELASPQTKTYSSPGASGEGKIKILSNITLPPAKGTGAVGGSVRHITLEPSSEAEALSNVASGIATSLTLVGDNGVVMDDPNYQNQFIEAELASVHGENASTETTTIPKLVTADGTELQLTQSQKDEIISQLQSTGSGNDVVMVLNEDNFSVGSTIQLDEGVQIVDTSSQNIMVMYSQPEGGESEHNDSQKSDSKVAEVTTASEDDNSQASVSLSEDKATSSIADKQPSLEGGDESQDESRRTDTSDKPEAEDEGNTTMDDDVDMSAGDVTSETNETLQQAVKDELMDLEDELRAPDTSADGTKEEDELNDSEDRQQSDKLKLISELEGDWSEDTAEEQPRTPAAATISEVSEKVVTKKLAAVAAVVKKPTPASTPAAKSASKSDGEKKSAVEVAAAVGKKRPPGEALAHPSKERKKSGEEKLSEKEIDKLLDDWNNESKLDDLTDEADLEKAIAKVTTGTTKATTGENGSKKSKEAKKNASVDDVVKEEPETAGTAGEEAADKETEEEATVSSPAEGKESDTEGKGKKNGTTSAETSRSKLEDDTGELEQEPEEEEEEEGDDEGEDEEDKDKSNAKSKEVSSLLGEWDEDDDL